MQKIIDLRSDTVTKPTPAMLQAMMDAKVGDDVFGDDPTVNELESFSAKLFGKEAALFCTSGTMTNQIAINVHTRPGNEVVCSQYSHIYQYEGGGVASNSGVQVKLLPAERGLLTAKQVLEAINPDDVHLPKTVLVSLENTHNRGGGSVYNPEEIKSIKQVCQAYRLKLHLDGARLFNATTVTGETASESVAHFDSVSVCLSKGLGCPVGSLLLGSKSFIHEARRVRKRYGGGWRQAGFLAAAGLYALNHNIERLKEDHRRAKHLAETLTGLSYVENVMPAETSNVIFTLKPEIDAAVFQQKLTDHGILTVRMGPTGIRFVTHLEIDDAMIEEVCKVMKGIG
ncbi:MAG: low-specificity L-threonine aldolase [Flavobacteriaceae bacterium]|nr:low-specificity L-threonine aldolase [Flavobacteriaceae bacterium]